MTARAKTPSVKAPLVTALTVLGMLLATAPAHAFYPPIGAKPDGAGGYMNPNDGMCVVGVAADGTMRVDWSITAARDCVAYTTGLNGMTPVDITAQNVCGAAIPPTGACNTQALCTRPNGSAVWNAAASKCFDVSSCVSAGASNASCTAAGLPLPCCTGLGTGTCGVSNDGYKHTFVTTNTCVNAADPTTAISLMDLDRTVDMCKSKGGTTLSPIPGTCIAYGWVYRNRKDDNSLPISGSGVSTTDGVQSTDNLGFCYTGIRMTGGSFNTSATCPSIHNAPATAPAGEWPACASSTTGCQTQASYDAGLGWSFTGGNCVYAFGRMGTLSANVTNAAGTATTAGTAVDLTGITNQGDCLAAGFSWDNWLPAGVPPNGGPRTNSDTGYTGMPASTTIMKLDALTPVEGGGGEFFSGTGFNCLRCHSDQSRAFQERNKPGFVKSRHLKAGDDPSKPFAGFFMSGSSSWGLQGVECTMCHSTAKPAQDDLIQVVPAGVVGPPAAGAPKSATGHNQTEYGAHLLDICYTCHGSPANPTTTNPASVIPVSGGDFALTNNTPGPPTSNLGNANCTAAGAPSACCTGPGTGTCLPPPNVGGLAPIVNQFLNSPHAQYTGTSLKVDIGNKNNYGSTFEGYVCRTANGVGQGSIITTFYRNGKAEKIPNLDSTTNPACTNPGDGSSTSGAGGFWVKDGETSPGVPTDTAQGNCMTCHDVHWALADTDPEAEPFRRECPTCHVNSGTSASGAPQIDLTTINHLKTAGTPLENWQTDPAQSCEICHMPKSGGSNSSFMHLWRINTDPNYHTMGPTQANLVADGDYTNAAWVDLDHACGQCHGADSGTAKPGVPYFTTAELSLVAQGMHNSASVSYPVTFNITTSLLTVTVTPVVDCGGTCPAFNYHWDFGDGTSDDTADPTPTDQHTYGTGGSYSITLTVALQSNGGKVGSQSRSFTLSNPASLLSLPDPINATCTAAGVPYDCCTAAGTGTCATCSFDSDTWTMSVTATPAGGTPPLQAVFRWGDSSDPRIMPLVGPSATAQHTYLSSNNAPYTVTEQVIDAKLHTAKATCAVDASPARFRVTGTVLGNSPLANALVKLKKGTTLVKYVYTPADGTFTLKNVKPGSYTLKVVRSGFTFPSTPVTVGPDSLGNVITGTPQ